MKSAGSATAPVARRVWFALPTYNERLNLEPLVDTLLSHVPAARVLVVDDNSPDGTGRLADEIAARDRRVQVLHRPGKQGLGAAYRAAFRQLLERPDCDVIVQMDCDFSHDPRDATRLLEAIDEGADLVLGSRYVPGGGTPGWTLGRRLVSRGGSGFARAVLRLPAHDLTGGFKAWRADLLRSLDLERIGTQGYGFQIEMTWWAHRHGAAIREIPIVFGERRAGQSKMSRRIVVEALLMVLRLRLASYEWLRPGASAGLRTGQFVGGLMRATGGKSVDHLRALHVIRAHNPPGGGLAAHHAGDTEARS